MPNGYSDAMRVFTKVLQPGFSYLREIGYLSAVYVDNSYLHQNIQRMFTKRYRNRQVVTISWVYYLPRKVCATTHTTINIFRICSEFQNYDSHSERSKKRKNYQPK